ncbi:hypothetical protein COX21_01240, partial [Candidatus Falkowbacteria bacterium CG23_combo_of_CG06-09_8_20_14_all_41_10]
KVKENLPATADTNKTDKTEDAVVGVADSGVATTGLTVYTSTDGKPEEKVTSTPAVVEVKKDAKVILDDAEKLFNAKDYSGTLDKLDEASIIIQQ